MILITFFQNSCIVIQPHKQLEILYMLCHSHFWSVMCSKIHKVFYLPVKWPVLLNSKGLIVTNNMSGKKVFYQTTMQTLWETSMWCQVIYSFSQGASTFFFISGSLNGLPGDNAAIQKPQHKAGRDGLTNFSVWMRQGKYRDTDLRKWYK